MNQVNIIGRLTRDSELKYTQSGAAISKFSIAVDRYMGQGKEKQTSFFEVTLWGKRAEALNQYLTKGHQVGITGELVQNRWEQDGQKRSKVEINASDITLVGGKQGGSAPAGPSADGGFEDDIPF